MPLVEDAEMPRKVKATVLVVEDEREIREAVCELLKKKGMVPVPVAVGGAAREHIDRVDIVVLDLNLPDIDGFEVLQEIRQKSSIPVLIMSARSDGSDRVRGLDLGADDYLGKPVFPPELVARVHALLRRARSDFSGRMVLDENSRTATSAGLQVSLTPQEFDLLSFLSNSADRAFTREELIAEIWGDASKMRTRRVDLIVSNIRTRFSDQQLKSPIQSVWGVGYRFQD